MSTMWPPPPFSATQAPTAAVAVALPRPPFCRVLRSVSGVYLKPSLLGCRKSVVVTAADNLPISPKPGDKHPMTPHAKPFFLSFLSSLLQSRTIIDSSECCRTPVKLRLCRDSSTPGCHVRVIHHHHPQVSPQRWCYGARPVAARPRPPLRWLRS